MQSYPGRQQGRRRSISQKKQWMIHAPCENIRDIARSLKVSELLAQVLINRGIRDTACGLDFLRPKLTSLISPESMPGAACAVERIKQAISKNEKITSPFAAIGIENKFSFGFYYGKELDKKDKRKSIFGLGLECKF